MDTLSLRAWRCAGFGGVALRLWLAAISDWVATIHTNCIEIDLSDDEVRLAPYHSFMPVCLLKSE